MKRGFVLSLATLALAVLATSRGTAATVTVTLDLYYSDSNGDKLNDTAAQGTWQLVARSSAGDNRGIAGLDTAMTVNAANNVIGASGASFLAPTGSATVGGAAGQAGFQTTYTGTPNKTWAQDQDASATTLDMLFGQVPVAAPGTQGLFYDVGLTGGAIKASNSAGQPAVTALSPAVVTWNFDDALGDWLGDGNQGNSNGPNQGAVILAFGKFNAGAAPSIAAGVTAANVFTALGTASNPPTVGQIASATVDPIVVRNNLTNRNADFTLDNIVDAADIGALFGGFDGGVADRTWQQGDSSGDKRVDAADIGQLFAAFTGDPGPTGPGTVKAEYNPATGEIKVTTNGVGTWYIEALGKLTGAEPTLPTVAGSLITNNDNRIGQSLFGGTMSYQDASLGIVAQTGLTLSDFVLKSSVGLGSPEINGEVTLTAVIPEPASVALLAFASVVGVGFIRRKAA